MIYLYYIFLAVLVSSPFLSILFIFKDISKRKKIQEKSVIIALWDINLNLIVSILEFIGFIILFKIFLIIYFEAYSILIPDYLNKWYRMFDYNSMLKIKDIFFQNIRIGEIRFGELITINNFMGLGLQSCIFSIVLLSTCISNLRRGLQRKTVSIKGVYYLGRTIKWVEIVEYEWKCPLRKNNIIQKNEYYKLFLNVKNDKFTKWLFYEDTSKYTLKISSHDKEKVDCLINSININMIIDNKIAGV